MLKEFSSFFELTAGINLAVSVHKINEMIFAQFKKIDFIITERSIKNTERELSIAEPETESAEKTVAKRFYSDALQKNEELKKFLEEQSACVLKIPEFFQSSFLNSALLCIAYTFLSGYEEFYSGTQTCLLPSLCLMFCLPIVINLWVFFKSFKADEGNVKFSVTPLITFSLLVVISLLVGGLLSDGSFKFLARFIYPDFILYLSFIAAVSSFVLLAIRVLWAYFKIQVVAKIKYTREIKKSLKTASDVNKRLLKK